MAKKIAKKGAIKPPRSPKRIKPDTGKTKPKRPR